MPLPPNWNKFKKVVNSMINTDLGAVDCTIETLSEITYDMEDGEIEGEKIVENVKLALIPINYKDDLKDLPQGLRDKVSRRVFSDKPIANNAIITSLFDNVKFRVIAPSQPMTAGGIVHCYRTYIGQIETELGTTGTLLDEQRDEFVQGNGLDLGL